MDKAMLGEIELANEEELNNEEMERLIDFYLDTLERHELIELIKKDKYKQSLYSFIILI